MSTAETKLSPKLSNIADKFFHSAGYIAIVTLAGILGFIFRQEMYAIYFVVCISAISWMLCKDLLPTFIAMMIIAMVPLARYGEVGYFNSAYYIPIILVVALIVRVINFPTKLRLGRFFVPTLIVAIAITTGGIMFLSIKEYFSMPGIYYVGALGLGMVVVNVVLESNIPHEKWDNIKFFAQMMVGVGIMGIAMIASNYIKHHELIDDDKIRRLWGYFQWGNNLSNYLLLSMPFAFYLSLKGKFSMFYFVVGILQYFALVLSLSRGGIIFGTLVFPPLVIATIAITRKNKWKFIATLLILLSAIVILFIIYMKPLLSGLLGSVSISGDEARVNLYKLAWENFRKYTIFGTGLQYDGMMYYRPQPMCIYWYHSTIFQILGSLGAVGLLAYTVQFVYRLISLIEVKSTFNVFVMISVLGFAGYSMVNVGYFIPFPCMAILIQMFILVDRSNKMLKSQPALMKKERIGQFYG